MNFNELFPNYDVTVDGRFFKNGVEGKPFKSNKYMQVVLFDVNHKRYVLGLHTVVAMKYLDEFYKGCIVHHKDKNTHNNHLSNLQVLSRNQHSRLHADGITTLAEYVKKNGPVNKGKKMSEKFCNKCSQSAKLRGFNGNQFVDKFGNKK